jgi:site-specific DNA-methyltransferase (adenine-specific)
MDEVFDFKQMVVWDKGPMGMGWHYRRSYETVLVGQKRGGACKWYDDSHRIENIIRPNSLPAVRRIIPSAEQHPTEKPVGLAMHFIGLHTEPGDTVLDPFMGTGSTGLACRALGRNFIGFDINPDYVEIARQRIAADCPLFNEAASE